MEYFFILISTVDPLLRNKIWSFLVNMTRSSQISVIITTHYIEEARQADICGLMRFGVLLEEDCPSAIMEKHHCETLEQAFLKLCVRQTGSENQLVSNAIPEPQEKMMEIDEKVGKMRNSFPKQVMKALMYKNFLQLIRTPRQVSFRICF